jgi:F-type H+-transporting ATPase subunit b
MDATHAAKPLPPFLDPATFPSQLFWLAIFFLALYLILSRGALPRVKAVLDRRAARLSEDMDEAKRLSEDVKTAIASYEEARADAKARAQTIALKNREEIAQELANQRREADQQIGVKMGEAQGRIEKLKHEASFQIETIATETAQAVVARLLGKTVDPADLQGAVNEALGK